MPQASPREVAHQMGRTVDSVTSTISTQYGSPVTANELVLRSQLTVAAGSLTEAARAYFVYMGLTTRRVSPQTVAFFVTTVGVAPQIGEVGVFASPTAPKRRPQILTCLMASSELDDLTTLGIKGNKKMFTENVDGGTHIWAGYRVSMGSGQKNQQPALVGLAYDCEMGDLLSTANAAPFVAGKKYSGTILPTTLAVQDAPTITWQSPNLLLHIA